MHDETVLIFGYEEWGIWRQTHDLAYLLAREDKVVFVQPSVPYERLRWRRERQRDYLRRFRPQPLTWIDENLAVASSSPMLPLAVSIISRFFHDRVERHSLYLSKLLQAQLLRRQLQRANLSPTALFVYSPFDLLMAGHLGENVSCWRVYDEVSRFEGWEGSVSKLIQETEEHYVRRVDLVFASSQAQFEKRTSLHPCVYLLPNAVSFDMFHKALAADLPEPEDIKGIPHPRLGYVGKMDWSVDFDLLSRVVTSHPEWSLVMIGPPRGAQERQMADALGSLPNVYMLGFKPHPQVPTYLKWFDVGLMPYRLTPDKLAAYPTKMHEYLALGLPVVSTALPEVEVFRGVIRIANSPAEFGAMVAEALATDSAEQAQARIAVARENSWEKRLDFMREVIEQRLGHSQAG